MLKPSRGGRAAFWGFSYGPTMLVAAEEQIGFVAFESNPLTRTVTVIM
jgi:hypothetical protein